MGRWLLLLLLGVGSVFILTISLIPSDSDQPDRISGPASLELATPSTSQIISAGETIRLPLTIRAENLSTQSVQLSAADVPTGWDVSFRSDQAQIAQATLQPNSPKLISLVVTAPDGAQASKTHSITVNAFAQEGDAHAEQAYEFTLAGGVESSGTSSSTVDFLTDVTWRSNTFVDFADAGLSDWRHSVLNTWATDSFDRGFTREGDSRVLYIKGGIDNGGGGSQAFVRQAPASPPLRITARLRFVQNPQHNNTYGDTSWVRAGVTGRYQGVGQGYGAWLDYRYATSEAYVHLARMDGKESRSNYEYGTDKTRLVEPVQLPDFDPTAWHTIELVFQEDAILVLVDGREVLRAQDDTYSSGQAGLYYVGSDGGGWVQYDGFSILTTSDKSESESYDANSKAPETTSAPHLIHRTDFVNLTSSRYTTPLAIYDNTLYHVSYNDNDHFVLNARNPEGELLWKFDFGKTPGQGKRVAPLPISKPKVGPNGNIYVNSSDILYSFNSEGKLRWTFKARNSKSSATNKAVIGNDGTIYFYAAGFIDKDKKRHIGILYAITTNGQEKWKERALPNVMTDKPCCKRTAIRYAQQTDRRIEYARLSMDKRDSVVYLNAKLVGDDMKRSMLLAFDTEDFITDRPNRGPSLIYSGHKFHGKAYLKGDTIYIVDATNPNGNSTHWPRLIALTEDGQKKWEYTFRKEAIPAIEIVNKGSIYVSTFGPMEAADAGYQLSKKTAYGKIYAFNNKGQIKWSHEFDNFYYYLTVINNRLYAGSYTPPSKGKEKLTAMSLSGKAETIIEDDADVITGPVAGADGKLYFVVSNRFDSSADIYAVSSAMAPGDAWPDQAEESAPLVLTRNRSLGDDVPDGRCRETPEHDNTVNGQPIMDAGVFTPSTICSGSLNSASDEDWMRIFVHKDWMVRMLTGMPSDPEVQLEIRGQPVESFQRFEVKSSTHRVKGYKLSVETSGFYRIGVVNAEDSGEWELGFQAQGLSDDTDEAESDDQGPDQPSDPADTWPDQRDAAPTVIDEQNRDTASNPISSKCERESKSAAQTVQITCTGEITRNDDTEIEPSDEDWLRVNMADGYTLRLSLIVPGTVDTNLRLYGRDTEYTSAQEVEGKNEELLIRQTSATAYDVQISGATSGQWFLTIEYYRSPTHQLRQPFKTDTSEPQTEFKLKQGELLGIPKIGSLVNKFGIRTTTRGLVGFRARVESMFYGAGSAARSASVFKEWQPDRSGTYDISFPYSVDGTVSLQSIESYGAGVAAGSLILRADIYDQSTGTVIDSKNVAIFDHMKPTVKEKVRSLAIDAMLLAVGNFTQISNTEMYNQLFSLGADLLGHTKTASGWGEERFTLDRSGRSVTLQGVSLQSGHTYEVRFTLIGQASTSGMLIGGAFTEMDVDTNLHSIHITPALGTED